MIVFYLIPLFTLQLVSQTVYVKLKSARSSLVINGTWRYILERTVDTLDWLDSIRMAHYSSTSTLWSIPNNKEMMQLHTALRQSAKNNHQLFFNILVECDLLLFFFVRNYAGEIAFVYSYACLNRFQSHSSFIRLKFSNNLSWIRASNWVTLSKQRTYLKDKDDFFTVVLDG